MVGEVLGGIVGMVEKMDSDNNSTSPGTTVLVCTILVRATSLGTDVDNVEEVGMPGEGCEG